MTVDLAAPFDSTEPVAAEPSKAERWALRIMQVGVVAIVLVSVVYKAFELDRFFLPKELILHLTAFSAGLLVVRTFRRVVFSAVDALLIAFLLLGLVSAIAATNVWIAGRALAVSVSGITVFWVARTLREARLERALLNALALAVVLGAFTSCLQAYGVRTDLFSLNRAPGGTLGNRNFVAHLSAFGAPVVLLATLMTVRTRGYVLGMIGMTILTVALVLTRSRAGWLAAAAVLVVWVAAFIVSPPIRRNRTTRFRLAGIGAALGLGVAAALLLPNSLRWRSDNPYLESVRGMANFQEGSGAGRLVQYRRTLRIAVHDPVLGAGPGNWAVEYPKYAARRDPSMNNNEAGMTSNPWPSSDWVAFIAERGLPAAILLLLVFVGISLRAMQRLLTAWTSDEALAAATVLATVFGALVAGMFDAVLLLALPTMLVWATLGALWTPAERRLRLSTRAQTAVLLILVVAAGLGALRSAGQVGAITLYSTQSRPLLLSLAAGMDPGNYRLRVRLARSASGLNRAKRCRHARAANALYPSAQEARALSRRCIRR